MSEISKRVVLTDDKGNRDVFDVTVDFEAVAYELQAKARYNRSYCSVAAGGAVKVQFKPWLGREASAGAPCHIIGCSICEPHNHDEPGPAKTTAQQRPGGENA